MDANAVETRILILSDTHGQSLDATPMNHQGVDVVIHCGDLTEHSKISEMKATLDLLKSFDAPLKIIIAGNHDFTLDPPTFQTKLAEGARVAGEALGDDLVKREFGSPGEPLTLLEQAGHGIVFLHEGTHNFTLGNGARLKVYASPYTPASSPNGEGAWAFQYSDRHQFLIEDGTDIVISHGPPRGIMDMTATKKRIGCPDLFASVAHKQPRVHCFGHVHNGWGAKMVAWRPQISDTPSHFADIDNDRSELVANFASLKASTTEQGERPAFYSASHGGQDFTGPKRTLMVNAALMGDEGLSQPSWMVDVDLPRA